MNRDPQLLDLVGRLDRIARALEARLVPSSGSALLPQAGRAFVWDGSGEFRPARRPALMDPGLLVGVDGQKEALYGNVRAFVRGAPAHDVLLWGERGTGKSSLVRSLLSVFDEEEVALVELSESRLGDLPRILDALDADPRRWVLYLDDLSFRGPGDRYRELKVLLEGGLEARPANTLAVATSNRRHLVPEAFPLSDEIHPEETVAEIVSLADRFGLSLGFYAFDERTYLEAVRRHLADLGLAAPPPGWETDAVRWGMARGIRSGRAALQAAREIAGKGVRSGS